MTMLNMTDAFRFFLSRFLRLLTACALVLLTVVPVQAAPANLPVDGVKLAAGRQHSALLLQDGSLYVWGDNTYGQLGFGDLDYLDEPRRLQLPGKAVDVSLGFDHTLVLLENGSVYAMGRNSFGQLGNRSTSEAAKPVIVDGLPDISAVAAGAGHSLALDTQGGIWGWGDNSSGQLGEPHGQPISDEAGKVIGHRHINPHRLVQNGAVSIAAGGNFSLYVNTSGHLLAWGDNSRGQLGDGGSQTRPRPQVVNGLSSVKKLAAGFQHVLAVVEENGSDILYAWGDHTAGQLGLESPAAGDVFLALPQRLDPSLITERYNGRIASISAGFAHSVAIVDALPERGGSSENTRQQILVWGDNSYGQLSLPTVPLQQQPVVVRSSFHGFYGDDYLPFTAVACGGFHSLIMSSKALLAASGRGDRGQLGTQSVINRDYFTHVAIPDLVRPGWTDDATLTITRLADGQLQLSWPPARDNIRVSGYRLAVMWSDGSSHQEELALVEQWMLPADYPANQADNALQAAIFAFDEAGRLLPDSSLSVLSAYMPPEQQPEEPQSRFFSDPFESKPLVDESGHLWRPGQSEFAPMPEVPWDMTAIYKPEELPQPPDQTRLLVVISAAALLALAVLATVLYIRRRHRKQHPKSEEQAASPKVRRVP